jgi:hypothetical protein
MQRTHMSIIRYITSYVEVDSYRIFHTEFSAVPEKVDLDGALDDVTAVKQKYSSVMLQSEIIVGRFLLTSSLPHAIV